MRAGPADAAANSEPRFDARATRELHTLMQGELTAMRERAERAERRAARAELRADRAARRLAAATARAAAAETRLRTLRASPSWRIGRALLVPARIFRGVRARWRSRTG